MKVLKWIGIFILIIISVVMIVYLTQDSQLKVKESIVINASTEQIMSQIADYGTWKSWSAWNQIDPHMTSEITRAPATVRHKSIWRSTHRQIGNGGQEIIEISPNTMKSKLLFEDYEGESFACFILEEKTV